MSGQWDVIIPELGTNLAQNPNANIAGGLTAVSTGTVTRSTTYSFTGSGCHRIQASTDNDGGYFTLTACANAIHYVTLRIHTASDVDAFDVSLDNSNWNDMSLLSTEGSWWVYGVQIPAAQANGSTKLYVQQKGAGAIDLYIGHVQVEQNTYATTPITGDIVGFLSDGYKWNGTPNASSSTRSAQERSGGKVVDLHTTYNVKVRWASGIGMAPISHQAQRRALMPGMTFYGAKVEPRVIDLTTVMGTSYTPATIHSVRKTIIDALKLDRVKGSQPVVLRYRGALSTKPVEFHAVYDSGLGFDMGGNDFDQPVIRMICYDPYAYEIGEASASFQSWNDVTDANYGVERFDGQWELISSSLNGAVEAIAKKTERVYYLGGAFTNIGDADGDYITQYDSSASSFTSLGSGMDSAVYDMVVAPNGDLYAVGAFTLAGGVANTAYVAYWDLSAGAWKPLATGLGDVGRAIALDQSGNIWVGGDFLNQADADGDYIAYWNGSAWASAAPMSGIVYDIAVGKDGTVYAAGAFATSGTTTLNGIAYWTGSAWAAMGTGLAGGSAIGYSIEFDEAGNVYVGGDFTSAGGVSANNIAKWNGRGWEALGAGVNGTVSTVKYSTEENLLYAFGGFTTAGGLDVSRSAGWNGSTWVLLPCTLPGSVTVYAAFADGSDLLIGYDTAGITYTSYPNTITNSGTARSYPTIHIKRVGGTSATVAWLKNETTGATVYLDYDLLDGEELTIDFRMGRRSVKSSFYGEVIGRAVLRGSDYSGFYLLPGVNNFSAYVVQAGSPTMTEYMTWKTTHEGADGAAA